MSKQIFQILARPIAFHRCLVPIAGSVNAALMLSQAIYWTPRTRNGDGWFYKSQADWEEETGLTRREQETARKQLSSKGLWDEKLKGVPATLYFRVDVSLLESSLAESAILVCTKAPNLIGGNSQTSMAESAELSQRLPETTSKEALAAPGFMTLILEAKRRSRIEHRPADDILRELRAAG